MIKFCINNRIVKIVLISLLIACTQLTPARSESLASASIIGYVRNNQTGEYLPQANLRLIDTPYGTATDNDGYYIFSDLPPDSYQLEVTYLGFEASSIEITVESKSPAPSITLTLHMPQVPPPPQADGIKIP